MKRTILISSLALALLVPAVAEAAFVSGFYKGRTTNSGPVSFRATQSKLSKLRIGVVFNCTDGDRFQTILPASAPTAFFPSQNIVGGAYSATFTGSRGASRYIHRGTITNRRATGTFIGTRKYNTDDELDPQGTVICRTGTLRYSIPRIGP